MRNKIIKAICTFETDCGMLKSLITSVSKSPLPEIRACLPVLIAAQNRMSDVTFDEYFKEISNHE